MQVGIVRSIVKYLSPKKKFRLRKAIIHINGLVAALFHPAAYDFTDARTLFLASGQTFLRLAMSYGNISAIHKREKVKRSLMEKANFEERYYEILKTRYLKSLFNDEDIYNCTLGAACYARGEVDDAFALFELAIRNNPTPFNYLCLSRCASHGLSDDRRAIKILNSALQQFPGDFSLVLSMATANFRLGRTNRANEYLNSIREKLTVLRDSEPKIDQLAVEISNALKQKLMIRAKHASKDVYSEEFAEYYWNDIWYHMNSFNRFQQGWGMLNYLYQKKISKILTQIAPNIRTVVNFGVFCANPDYHLAKQFPNTMFVGVDREACTKELNDKAYNSPNLRFLSAEIMDVLPNLAKDGCPSLLFHARTGTLCYPEFLRNFYISCADAGVEYIALWENISLCRTTLKFHDFEDMPADSIPHKSVMFIHNYKKFLEEAGYKIVENERKSSNMDLLRADSSLAECHVFVVAQRV